MLTWTIKFVIDHGPKGGWLTSGPITVIAEDFLGAHRKGLAQAKLVHPKATLKVYSLVLDADPSKLS